VSRNGDAGPQETARDVWDYLKFAGFELTRDQLVRLHQRHLINEPFLNPNGWRDPKTTFPAGTAERMLRIAQLKSKTKHLDELAWRLWWEGSSVDPGLIREYVTKIAQRWDDRLNELRTATNAAAAEEEQGERDVLDEVFFQHLKLAPSMTTLRKRLGRGSDIYVEFAGLLIDLLGGEFSLLHRPETDLFARPVGHVDAANDAGRRWSGNTVLDVMNDSSALPYVEVVASLNDAQIESARPVALLFTKVITEIGEIVHESFASTARTRDTAGKSLIVLSENPEEQVLFLLLTTSFLKDDRIRANLPDFEKLVVNPPVVSYQDYQRLKYLAREVPGLEEIVSPERMREAFESPEGAEQWRALFDRFRLEHFQEIEDAIADRPDLFGLRQPPGDELEEESDFEGESKKKK
jgi:hypothetical protein